MTPTVTALLVGINEPNVALKIREAIDKQTVKVLEVIETSNIAEALTKVESSQSNWFWLFQGNVEPKPNALQELLNAREESTTIGQVGPMLLESNRPRYIHGLGLTLSKFGDIISPVTGQMDQGQHDIVEDVLAVDSRGSLIRADILKSLNMGKASVPQPAASLDLSVRVRRHGMRVVVAPRAKVVTQPETNWRARKSAVYLHLVHDSLPLALIYWLFLPLNSIYRVFMQIAQKRPGLIWSELAAGIYGFMTLPARLAARTNVGSLRFKDLNALRATANQVANHRKAEQDALESAHSLAAFERGVVEVETAKTKSFSAAGGWIWMLLLLAISFKQIPAAESLSSGATLPVASDFGTIFARAGASWQPIGQGFFGPSDPFNWALLLIGSFTFWAPNLAFVILLWFARALAFASAWRAFGLLTGKAWVKNIAALAFALLPAFTEAISQANFAMVIATIATPWLVFSVARAAGLGRSGSARSDLRTWSWVGVSGVLLAIVGSASPTLAVLAMLGLALVAFTKIRRLGYLFWIPLPLFAIYLPLAMYEVIGLAHPLALLSDPTVANPATSTALASLFDSSNPLSWSLVGIAALSLAALAGKRWVVALSVFGFGLVTWVIMVFVQSLRFPADLVSIGRSTVSVSNTGLATASVIGLVAIGMAVLLITDLSSKAITALAGVVLVVSSSALAVNAVMSANSARPSTGSVVPLLLEKQALTGTDLQVAVVNQMNSSYRVQWLPISGVHLVDSNLAYRFSSQLIAKNANYLQVAQVIGDLASANGQASAKSLVENKIGYILVPQTKANTDLVSALESSPILESAGLTPFGELWRVSNITAADAPATDRNPWSVTKAVQLISLFGFILLAIPSRARNRLANESEIFIDQSESDLDV